MVANGTSYNLTLVAKVEGDLARLSTQLNQVTAAAEKAQASMSKTTGTGSQSMVAGLKDSARGLLQFFGVISAGRYVLDATTQFQQFDNAVKSFTGSADVAAQAFKDVQEIASRGFDINPLLRAEQTFLSLGYSLDQSKQFVESIAKIGSATDSAALDRISLAMTQIAAKGKVSLEEIRQLGEAGVPALKLFADAAGLSASEFQKQASLGKVLSADVLPKVIAGIDKLYGEAYKNRESTLFGGIAKAQVELQNLARTWGEELTPALNVGLSAFDKFLGVAQKVPPQMVLAGIAIAKFPAAFAKITPAISSSTFALRAWAGGAATAGEAAGLAASKLGKMKAGLLAAAAVVGGSIAAGFLTPEDAANIDNVTASLKNLADTQNLSSLATIKYADNFREMMNLVNNPGFGRRAADALASVGGILGIGPGRSKDSFEFLQNLKQIDTALANMVKTGQSNQAKEAFDFLKSQVAPEDLEAFIAAMPQYEGALKGVATGAYQAADAVSSLADKQKALKNGFDIWAESATQAGRAFLQQTKIVDAFTSAVADAKKATDKSKKVSADEKDALLGIASAALDVTESQIKAGKSVDTITKSMEKSRAKFIETATNMGMSAEAAKKLADNAGLVPKNIGITFKSSGLGDLAYLNQQLKGISDYEKATGQRLSSQRMEISARLETTYKLIASQTIPVYVTNPTSFTGGASSRSAGSGGGQVPGTRMGAVPVVRHAPVRMVSI